MSELNSSKHTNGSEIAIIGMSGRFPGANDIDAFWQNLREGVESVSFFSDEELLASGINPTLLSHPNYVKAKSILSDIELFDAEFFGFNPKEAETTDLQHRLFLESAWDAIETAGYNPETFEGSIGVYAGVETSTYLINNICPNFGGIPDLQTFLGNATDYLSTRVSYKLNLKGPSVTVQTACSTSLVAVHMACQSLLNGECDLSLAGGISVTVPNKAGYFYQEGGVASPDGHCRAFDARAQGTIFGNGVGIVVLKRLADAITDGDCIQAIIKGSAINNDGSLKVGYTAPSPDGQSAVISEAQAIAGIKPETVTYIETHGTGTALGDPIEVTALTQVFRQTTDKKKFCAIGSVKTNFGHLSIAAGVAGLIKTVLGLKHRLIPPSLHFEQPNPKIDFANSPFYVNTQLSEWKSNGTPRRAGVSSFGIGGTNAHVVLEEAPLIEPSATSRPWQLLMLSTKTNSALEKATLNLAEHLKQPDLTLADVAYTLGVGRQTFDHRRMLVCQNLDGAIKALESPAPQRIFTHYQQPSNRPIVFMFSGQGAQYVNMGQELYLSEPTFREQVDICCELLKPHLELDLRQVLYPSPEQTGAASQQLQQTAITQPALFVIEYALAQLWREWGVRPTGMMGHSVGEYVAATLAGVFSLEDALALVAVRGKLMQQRPSGSMLAVPLPEKQVQPLLGTLSLAAINGPSSCVVSGITEAVEALETHLACQGVECRRLRTSHAFHSQMMEPILEAFTQRVKQISLKAPRIPYISNLTGTWITPEAATAPSYWAAHLRQTVRLASGLQELLKQPAQILLEIGPGRTLTTLAKRHPDKKTEQVILSSLRHPQETGSDVAFLLNTLGQLWLNGLPVDWSGFYRHERHHRLPLPTYPFERQRYWIEPPQPGQDYRPTPVSLGKKPDIADWFYLPLWKQSVPLMPINQAELVSQKSCTLVFVDECDLGIQLVKRLKHEGHDVITVQVGSAFTQLSNGQYTLNPQQASGYDSLLKELLAQQKLPAKIVHCWSVTPASPAESTVVGVETAQNRGFYSLLFLAQALGKQNLEAVQITVVSNNMQPVTGEESLSPEKATLLGPVKVIPQEHPNISCRSIDVVLPPLGSWQQEKLTDQLLTELSVPNSEQVIAYRGHNRWQQTFEPMRLDESPAEKPRLREAGVYLITGGLGGIGLVLAKHLAKTVRAKLILSGRSALPAKEEWEKWLATHDETDTISRKIRQVQELEALGAEVLVVRADVANLAQMRDAIEKVQLRFGQLNGVIHAAGVAGGGVIQRKTLEEAESVIAPKVRGTLVLNTILKDIQLDFLILTSSIVSILGEFGQVDYAGANAFLDAFAHHKASQHTLFTRCINWGAWQEVGMAVNTAVSKELQEWRTENLQQGIVPKEGMDALMRLLGSTLPQVLVSPTDFLGLLDQRKTGGGLLSRLEKANVSKPAHPRPDLSSSYVAPRNETEQKISNIWQDLLGIEHVGIHDNFFELGGDSLLTVQVRSKLQETFDKDFLITDSFQYPTVSDLADYISREKIEQPAFLQANDRAKRQQDAMDEELQLIKRRKRRG